MATRVRDDCSKFTFHIDKNLFDQAVEAMKIAAQETVAGTTHLRFQVAVPKDGPTCIQPILSDCPHGSGCDEGSLTLSVVPKGTLDPVQPKQKSLKKAAKRAPSKKAAKKGPARKAAAKKAAPKKKGR